MEAIASRLEAIFTSNKKLLVARGLSLPNSSLGRASHCRSVSAALQTMSD